MTALFVILYAVFWVLFLSWRGGQAIKDVLSDYRESEEDNEL